MLTRHTDKSIKGNRYDYQNQGYVFPTNTPEIGLPTIGFDVGGKTFYVPKEALLFAETEPGWCYGGIQSRGDLPFDIWGDTWLKGVYAVCLRTFLVPGAATDGLSSASTKATSASDACNGH
jgi:hypothetical protein